MTSRFTPSRNLTLLLSCAALLASGATVRAAETIEDVQRQFQTPPDDARIMVRWWWFGPAVTKTEISRELHAMKDAGIGGVEIQPVYPVALDDEKAGIKTLRYLSDEHLDALRHANREARALGLRVDLTLGSGWPFGGPSVPITQAAGKLRVDHVKPTGDERSVKVPRLGEGEQLIAAFLARIAGTYEPAAIVNETATLPADLTGATDVLFFISSRTKQQVKRPSVGAEGYVLDHYDRTAVEAYLKNVGDRLLQAFDDQPPYAVFSDSLEVYGTDWTPNLLAEFQKRRGYDLKPLLPSLIADIGPRTAEIRHDWSQTLTDLVNDNFVRTLRDWASRRHTRFRMQAYGVPPATLSTNRFVDLPEGEGAAWKALSATRWATSASHLYDRPITSSETWTWLNSPAFRATPLDFKAEADLHFLQGVNQLIGHGWPYTGPQNNYPGWRFYASTALNDQNPWWIVIPDLARYLQRTSYLLRQGKPVNDIAVYLPEHDAWAGFKPNTKSDANMFESLRDRIGDTLVTRIIEAGYAFDFIDDDALREAGADRYKLILLPNVTRLPADTAARLEKFTQAGGSLIATRRLPDGPTIARARLVTDEKRELVPALNALLSPDVRFSAGQDDLGFVHRRTADADLYFLANTGNAPLTVTATFRVSATRADWWDPMSGTATPATLSVGKDGVTVPLELAAYGSRFLVFTHRTAAIPASPASASATPAPLDLSTGWRITFATGPTVTMDQLHSWSDDEPTRFYSGLATYEKTFDAPADTLRPGSRVKLNLGREKTLPIARLKNGMRTWIDSPVKDAAVVYVNGQRAGAIWHPPYELDVTAFLRPGANQLKIVVGNTAINALSGQPQPDTKPLNAHYGERFKPQDMANLKPLPSGLTGPVTLTQETITR